MFGGSTSSLTGMLSQVYFLISGLRAPDTSALSRPFQHMVRIFRGSDSRACSPHDTLSPKISHLVN